MRRALVLAAAALLAAPACGNLLEPAAAVVHGRKIPMDEIQALLDAHVETASYKQLAAQGDPGALQRDYEQQQLSGLILRAVYAPAAEERGIEVTEEEVETELDRIASEEFENRDQFEEALKEDGLTHAEAEEIVYDQLVETELRAAVVEEAQPTDADVRAYFEENPDDFELTRSQHILVEERGLAQGLAERLQIAPDEKLGKLFGELAEEHSIDPSAAQNGGDLGLQPPGAFVEPFQETQDRLEIGEVSDPVKTEFGWHVIRVTARRAGELEEVEARIRAQLSATAQEEAWREFLRDLLEEAEVKVNPIYGEFDEELGRVVNADADDIPAGEAPAPAESPSAPEIPIAPPPPPG